MSRKAGYGEARFLGGLSNIGITGRYLNHETVKRIETLHSACSR
jgi:hypothetical protein